MSFFCAVIGSGVGTKVDRMLEVKARSGEGMEYKARQFCKFEVVLTVQAVENRA